MNKVKIDDVEIAYQDIGFGDPLVFLHAFPLNQKMWDAQLSELSLSHRIITFDWRGFGESSSGTKDSSMPVFADDLAGLLDHLEIENANICGLSMGGYVALSFFRQYPDRIMSLILCDTKATADTDDGKRARYELADSVRREGPSALTSMMIPKLLGSTSLQNNPEVVKLVQEIIEQSQPEGVARALIGMAARIDSTDLLEKISKPTMIIVGKEDILTPPDEAIKMSKSIASSQLNVIKGAGHLPNMERPEDFNQCLNNFLQKI